MRLAESKEILAMLLVSGMEYMGQLNTWVQPSPRVRFLQEQMPLHALKEVCAFVGQDSTSQLSNINH